jgi:hypothetical protein
MYLLSIIKKNYPYISLKFYYIMKKRILLVNTLILTFFISCSKDYDDTALNNINVPLTTGDYWVYDVETDGGPLTEDHLFISGDVVIGANTYKKMETLDNLAIGFYSSSLRNNGVRQVQNSLLLTGDLSLNAGQTLPINLNLSLVDFTIFKGNARSNETLSTKTGTINETINGYPLTIDYQLRSIAGDNFASFTSPNNDVYTDVKAVKIVLTATVSTTISGFPITVLSNQDILTSYQYVANNIGVVHTNTTITYTIPQLIADQLNVPATSTQIQNEYLTNYFVQ